MQTIDCKQCGGTMKTQTKAQHNLGAQLAGVLVFLFGLYAFFSLPAGAIYGSVLMVGALFMGYSKRKLWVCGSCGYHFDRM